MVSVSGRHRMRSSIRGAGAAAAATALVVVVGGTWFGYQQLAGPSCSGEIELSVAAAPELAPAVQKASAQWVEEGAAVSGTCIAVNVSASEPVDVAAAVASKHGATLAGVGQASGTVVTPDIWIPDSSTWLLRLKNNGATAFAPGNGASIARSPVVVAMPEPVASRFGWPEQKLGWTDLLNAVSKGKGGLRAGIVEPTQDAAGLSGLLSLTAAAGAAGGDTQKATTGALRALATGRSALRQDLLARFPRANDPTSIASGLGAAALSEEDVMAYNSTKPPIPLAALYLEPAPMPLDYPFAVLPASSRQAVGGQGALRAAHHAGFQEAAGRPVAAGAGRQLGRRLQGAAGAPSPAGGPASAAPAGVGAAGGLDPSAIDRAVSGWSIATQPGRMLAVIDVSGSMKTKVPSANNATREQVTVSASSQGLRLFDDSWSIGLWIFSTELVGSRDWQELVPINPLSSNRGQLQQALAGIRPSKGNTGLYDTILEAYKTVQSGWEAGRVNSVVLYTDGKNDDKDGITQAQLLSELKQLRDPERPVQVIIIGIGNEVSKTELKAITDVTGGGPFVTEDPAKIGDIFLKGIALRPNAPR